MNTEADSLRSRVTCLVTAEHKQDIEPLQLLTLVESHKHELNWSQLASLGGDDSSIIRIVDGCCIENFKGYFLNIEIPRKPCVSLLDCYYFRESIHHSFLCYEHWANETDMIRHSSIARRSRINHQSTSIRTQNTTKKIPGMLNPLRQSQNSLLRRSSTVHHVPLLTEFAVTTTTTTAGSRSSRGSSILIHGSIYTVSHHLSPGIGVFQIWRLSCE